MGGDEPGLQPAAALTFRSVGATEHHDGLGAFNCEMSGDGGDRFGGFDQRQKEVGIPVCDGGCAVTDASERQPE